MKVALIVMPFAAANRPNLAVGLLQAGLRQLGIECHAKYFNITFNKILGAEKYYLLTRGQKPMMPLAGEWIFSQVFYGPSFSTWDAFEREVLEHPVWGMEPADRPAVRAALDAAPRFLRIALESCDWSRYDLVGFTSTFEQTLASLSLARMIRQRHPRVWIALGGANFEAGMGRPYIEHFDFIDFVSTGEADTSFPVLCRRLSDLEEGRAQNLEVPPGFLYRHHGKVLSSPEAGPVVDLDELPIPDYDDFYRVARASRDHRAVDAANSKWSWLPIEASRGCWWGQKAHCTFCGLNGSTMAFRQKSWRRVVEEAAELGARYGDIPLQFTDPILAMSFFKDLLPFWAQQRFRVAKFFEVKANLRRRQVRLLRDSGITQIQPGIESLSDDTLREMRKGVSGAQNIAFLRWCAEEGIHPSWNILYAFPREDLGDYELQLYLLHKLTHLPAPVGVGPIRLDRFSPNFTHWRQHGFTSIAPMPAYRHIFHFDESILAELAYFFQYEHPQLTAALETGVKIERFVKRWQDKAEMGQKGELAVKPHPEQGFMLVDTRYDHTHRTVRLNEVELSCLLACDRPKPRGSVLQRVTKALSGHMEIDGPSSAKVALDRLLERSIIAKVGPRLVTLALLPHEHQLAMDPWWNQTAAASSIERSY